MGEILCRGDLYQLVWSEPLRTLSKRFGISDVALAKRCRAANVPLPGVGLWAKKAAGKPFVQPQLPERGLGQSDSISIGAEARRSYIQDDEELLRSTLTPPDPFPDGLPEVLARARKIVGNVRGVSLLARPHALVARLLQDDEKRREKQKLSPFPSIFDAPIFESPFEKRRLRFMNSMLFAVARAGGRASLDGREGQELGVTIGDQHLRLKLGPVKPLPPAYPPKPLAAKEKMKVELVWYQPPPEVMTLWVDEEGQTLESQIEEIVVSLFAYAEWAYRNGIQKQYEYRVKRKRELEERVRQQLEEAEQKERARIAKIAAERRNKLVAEAAAWRRASDVRAYVEAQVAQRAATEDAEALKDLNGWAQWARAQADEMDPLRGEMPKP